MLHKTWNVRDQTEGDRRRSKEIERDLRVEADKLYREIESEYKLIKKISDEEEAHKIINRIWIMKSWANNIELELLRREYTNEA